MPIKELDPITPSQEDMDILEKEISLTLKEYFYSPLVQEIKLKNSIQNSRDSIVSAIQSGKIKFYRGEFIGKFNAFLSRALEKLGAKWSRKNGSFRILLSSLPIELKEAIRISEHLYLKKMMRLDKKLAAIVPAKLAEKMSIKKILSKSMFRISTSISESLAGIVVTPKFSAKTKKRILDEYTTNVKLTIKGWTEKEIIKLRKTMQAHVIKGMRYEDIIGVIQDRYSVSKSKARFWARQETNLFVSKIKEIRYTESGVYEYIWKNVIGSPDHPVRPMHKNLHNTIHRFDDPPVVNKKGDRKNPGEDYGCRCTARPIVRF